MSDDLSRRSAAGAEAERIDRVIDQVAREMTDGALPADFHARVLARIGDRTASAFGDGGTDLSRRWKWTFAAIAAAALVVVAIFVARPFQGRDRGPERPALQVSTLPTPHHALPSPSPQNGFGVTGPSPENRVGVIVLRRVTNIRRTPVASDIEALAPRPIAVPPIEIETLAAEPIPIPEIDAIESIAVAPLGEPESTNDQSRDRQPPTNDSDE